MEAAHTSRLRTQSPPPGVELCAVVVVEVDEVVEEACVFVVAPKHFILMEVLTLLDLADFIWLMQKSCEDVSLEVKGCESVTCRCWPLTEDWIVLQYGLNVINRKYNIRCPKNSIMYF